MLYLGKSIGGRSTEGTSADRAAARLRDPLSSETSEVNEDPVQEWSSDFSNDPMCTNCPNLAPKG